MPELRVPVHFLAMYTGGHWQLTALHVLDPLTRPERACSILLIATRRTRPFTPPIILESRSRSITHTGILETSSVSGPRVQARGALAAALFKSPR